tara:strand:- start:13364 stop:13876 length:513 start_codon:yes stop_codon:yes gene_type:complete
LKHRDYDDPEIFKQCVSAITLKGRPEGLLEEWLTESEVIITVANGRRKGPREPQPWLAVDELDEMRWASKIREAVIQSDHLEASSGLFMLSRIERITIFVLGDYFADSDLETFHNAIENMEKLSYISIFVAPSALAYAKEHFVWKNAGATYVIATTTPRSRHRSRPSRQS